MADRASVAEIEAAFRAQAGRALATVARLTGDLHLAEDAVQEAFVAALRTWPGAGLPDNPGAWVTTTARNRALDVLRRESTRPEREAAATRSALEAGPAVLHPVADDHLRLIFTCCHPALAPPARLALTLRLVCGRTVPEIARLLLDGEEAVAKRIQRAKGKVRDARISLRVPPPERLAERLPTVLEVVYLTYTEGYAATAGDDLVRHELCDEAVHLARVLADLLPGTGTWALLGLLLVQDARRPARIDDDGALVVLADQDRARWDRDRIAEGLACLDRAHATGPGTAAEAAYLLQAAIAAEHARAPSWTATDWRAIVAHYDQLLVLTASPVVALNRAIAVSFADGPGAAAGLLDDLAGDPRLARSHLLRAARADVCERLGDRTGAVAAYREARALARTAPERAHLDRRLAALTARDAALDAVVADVADATGISGDPGATPAT